MFAKAFRRYSTAIKYSAHGQASAMLKAEPNVVPSSLAANEVFVKFLAAPINPSDINMVEGVYGVNPKMPAIAGNEGVAEVTKVGSDVKSVKVGDWVIPSVAGFGTWRSEAVAAEDNFTVVPNDIPRAYAATIAVNPCTSYRLLRDFVPLKRGEYVIQNGANSMVGYGVIQMARELGYKTINIIREDRPDVEKTLNILGEMGGDVNITDKTFSSPEFREMMKDFPLAKLGLNCIGGDSFLEMSRFLAPNATLVTYGGMSKKPAALPADVVNYKQLNLRGFWITEWNRTHSKEERTKMISEIAEMIRSEKLTYFYELHDFDDFDYALSKHLEPYYFRKVVLNIDFPDRFKEHDAIPDEAYDRFEGLYK